MSNDASGFIHQASVYNSDDEFLAMAVPFVEDGLSAGNPVLVTTTPANLELLGAALGGRAREVDYAETAYFGRRPPQRVAAFHRYWKRQSAAAPGRQVRILAEPIWTGRSPRDVTAWKRMESTLNVALANTNIWMICPYDARVIDAETAFAARQTHPRHIAGTDSRSCTEYVDPVAFARSCDATPLPEAPPNADTHVFDGTLLSLRRFVFDHAQTLGLAKERAAMLVMAAGETALHLKKRFPGNAIVRMWEQPGAIVCEFYQPAGQFSDPFLGFRPVELQPGPDDGMWLTRQICDWVDIRTADDGGTIRLHIPGPRAEETLQPATTYTL
jgi:hypothetical protein